MKSSSSTGLRKTISKGLWRFSFTACRNASSNKRSHSSSPIQPRNCSRAKVTIPFMARAPSGAPSKKKFSTRSASISSKAKSAKGRPFASTQRMARSSFVRQSYRMDKQHILDEIRRTADARNGIALGWRRFERETGIRYADWYGKFWTKWGDAVREAGFQANRTVGAYDDSFLLEKLVFLTRELGRVPVQGDLLIAARNDPTFPSEKAFRRFGLRPQRAARMIAYFDANPGR